MFRVVSRILATAEELYAEGNKGIIHLPFMAALTINMASRLYREIGTEIIRKGPQALEMRMRVSILRKIVLMALSCLEMSRSIPERLRGHRKKVEITKVWSHTERSELPAGDDHLR